MQERPRLPGCLPHPLQGRPRPRHPLQGRPHSHRRRATLTATRAATAKGRPHHRRATVQTRTHRRLTVQTRPRRRLAAQTCPPHRRLPGTINIVAAAALRAAGMAAIGARHAVSSTARKIIPGVASIVALATMLGSPSARRSPSKASRRSITCAISRRASRGPQLCSCVRGKRNETDLAIHPASSIALA